MLLNWLASKSKNIVLDRRGAIGSYIGGSEVGPPGRFTDDFIYAATADLRCPKAMVEVTWANSAVDINAVITQNDINRIDRKGQLFNGETESGQKWAYLHSGLIADGSFHVMPELDSEAQAGWYGFSLVGDGSGDFSPAPYLQVAHDARSYTSILVAGDSEYNEYPVDFTITYTHTGGPTIQTITGNAERVYSTAFVAIKDVTAIRLTVTKWSAPSTIVKITQFSGALIGLYRTDDIVELNILEETNSDTGVVPIGNVSSNELDLSLLNTDRRFSYGNIDSVYLTSVRSGRKIRVWLGFILPVGSIDATGDVPGYIVETINGEKVGLMPYGIYWSKDWNSTYKSQVTTTTAYDITYSLSQKDFLRSDNYTGTVEEVVDAVLTKALEAIPDLKWLVSADTAAIAWAGVSFSAKSFLELLKDMAEATLAYTYVDRNGFLIVGSRLEAATPLEAWQKVDLSVYYNYESMPRIDELINFIRVGFTKITLGTFRDIYNDSDEFTIPSGGGLTVPLTWNTIPVNASTVIAELTNVTGSPAISNVLATTTTGTVTVTGAVGDTFRIKAQGVSLAAQSIYSSDEVFTVPAGGVLSLYIAWKNTPVDIDTVVAALVDNVGMASITDLAAYAYGGDIEITGTPGATFKVSATGTPFELKENTETTAQDTNSVNVYGVREFSLTGNSLVTTIEQAQEIADELLSLYGNLRQDGSMDWPASTLLSVGDTLEVTEFKSDTVETKDNFLIKRQSIKFNGAMQGRTDLRRG